jgi:hypothetical protein
LPQAKDVPTQLPVVGTLQAHPVWLAQLVLVVCALHA